MKMSEQDGQPGPLQLTSTLSRRRVLQLGAGGIGATGLVGIATESGATASGDTSVVFNDQTTPGDKIVLAELNTAEPVLVAVRTEDDRTVYRGNLDSGIDATEYTLTLSEIVQQDTQMSVSLYPDGGGSSLARDTASITIDDSVTFTDGLAVTRIEADPTAGFNYPYFVYVPRVRSEEASGPILVEPNNTGTAMDDFDEHLAAARDTARGDHNGGSGRQISDRLGVPLLVPAFPRPESEPVDWRHYTHQLDTETMAIESGDLARIDKQLLRMVEDARNVLSDQEYTARTDGMLLNGFSASGNFVNRFAALHPDEVLSVSAGGINGTAFLPITEADGHTLNYQIGAANIADLTREPFDIEAFRDVNQFLYMGRLISTTRFRTVTHGATHSGRLRLTCTDQTCSGIACRTVSPCMRTRTSRPRSKYTTGRAIPPGQLSMILLSSTDEAWPVSLSNSLTTSCRHRHRRQIQTMMERSRISTVTGSSPSLMFKSCFRC
jgi:hypothetical protein